MSVKKACDDSKASDFVNSWEKGIDENLTRRFDKKGKELSGGQWQRIALARAFFRNAPIVLLDEPSAALDPIAEHQIFDDFKRISNNKSAVLISHRLSSITLADRILVLENGHIIEQGSHQELIKMKGKYAYLFALQANKYV
jgi:ABC-type multidrug transport system fused ATPase/permease subunit